MQLYSKRLILRMTDKQEEMWKALFPLLHDCTWSDLVRHALMELVRANPHLRPISAEPSTEALPLFEKKKRKEPIKGNKKEVKKPKRKTVKV